MPTLFAIAGVIGLIMIVFLYGKSTGRKEHKTETDERTLNNVKTAKIINDMSDADIDKLSSKYD